MLKRSYTTTIVAATENEKFIQTTSEFVAENEISFSFFSVFMSSAIHAISNVHVCANERERVWGFLCVTSCWRDISNKKKSKMASDFI